MSEILVNKGELKSMRDTIDKMLHTKEQNVIRHSQYASYDSEQLNERQKEILKYVGKKSGATKEDVIKNNPHIGSRMTVLKAINDLIAMKMLIVKRNFNQHIQHLYTNNEHGILALINDLEFFKQVYFRLIDESNKKLKELWFKFQKKKELREYNGGWHAWMNMRHLLEALLMPYKNLNMMYIMSDLLLWQERPLDKETLHNKFTIVYGSMNEIHTKLHESIAPLFTSEFYQHLRIEPLNFSLYSLESGLSHQHIISFLRDYSVFRLGSFVEPVLDILWKISYPVLPHVDPFYASTDLEKLKDWRNIISGNKEFKYIPKTTQAENLGKLLR